MAVTEERRHRAHQRLEELMGTDDAATIMELLPPTGWADVARRDDLDRLGAMLSNEISHLEAVTSARFEAIDQRFEAIDRRMERFEQRIEDLGESLRTDFARTTRQHIATMFGSLALAIAAAKLLFA